MTPAVSVVIPAYNAAPFLEWALQTVLSQTLDHLEVIVVDDGSTDATGDIARGVDDPRVRCLRHDRNRGLPAARNTGIEAARASYVAFLDADDGMKPANLERKVAVLDRYADAVLVHSAGDGIDVNGAPLLDGAAGAGEDVRLERPFRGLLFGNSVTVSSVVARRDAVVEAGGFDQALRYTEDWDLWVRLARDHAFAYLPESLIWYRIHPESMSQAESMDVRAAGLERLVTKAFATFPLEQEGLDYADVYWTSYFRMLRNRADFLPVPDVMRLYGRAVRSHPRSLGSYSGFAVPAKIAVRGLVPRKLRDRMRFRRQAAGLAGR